MNNCPICLELCEFEFTICDRCNNKIHIVCYQEALNHGIDVCPFCRRVDPNAIDYNDDNDSENNNNDTESDTENDNNDNYEPNIENIDEETLIQEAMQNQQEAIQNRQENYEFNLERQRREEQMSQGTILIPSTQINRYLMERNSLKFIRTINKTLLVVSIDDMMLQNDFSHTRVDGYDIYNYANLLYMHFNGDKLHSITFFNN